MPTPARKRTAEDAADFLIRRLEMKSIDAAGTFRGYAAVFGERDEAGDICEAGCFTDTLADWAERGTLPRVKWRHFQTIGHCTRLAEDAHGLLVEGVIWAADVAAELRDGLAAGDEIGMSFGFFADPEASRYESAPGPLGELLSTRYLARVELSDDITITLRPVSSSTELLEVKSADGSTRRLPPPSVVEGLLRDAGCTRRDAKQVTARMLPAARDAGRTQLVAGLGEIAAMLRGA